MFLLKKEKKDLKSVSFPTLRSVSYRKPLQCVVVQSIPLDHTENAHITEIPCLHLYLLHVYLEAHRATRTALEEHE